jgi:hypothetical protein
LLPSSAGSGGERCAQMIDISVEIAEGQLKRFI